MTSPGKESTVVSSQSTDQKNGDEPSKQGVLRVLVPLWMSANFSDTEENTMKELIAKFSDQVKGVLSGFDRLVLRGALPPSATSKGWRAT